MHYSLLRFSNESTSFTACHSFRIQAIVFLQGSGIASYERLVSALLPLSQEIASLPPAHYLVCPQNQPSQTVPVHSLFKNIVIAHCIRDFRRNVAKVD